VSATLSGSKKTIPVDCKLTNSCVNALSWSDDGDILLSGSDDKRSVPCSGLSNRAVADECSVCIWTPDTSSIATSSTSPHPLKLSTTIHTGHGANIFSAKFLPDAGTPTVVSVAGDHEIRLIEIERLGQSSGPIVEDNGGHRADLWAQGGPG
jgi:nuclear receptor interaction protein